MKLKFRLSTFAMATLLAAAMTSQSMPSADAGVSVQLVKNGLNFPAGFTFAPDGTIFYGERFTGEIHTLSSDGTTDTLFATIPNVVTNGEQGLLGIALDPSFGPSGGTVFAYATRNDGGTFHNDIISIPDNSGVAGLQTVIFSSDTDAGAYHDGGRIMFGSDAKLYAVVGEGHSPANSQDLSTNAGKVLRMNPDGSVPSDNPFPGKLIWSYGLRNSFGFTFDPQTGRLWETENGPECNDEINRILKGRNYGWGPSETCSSPPAAPANTNRDGPKPVMPKAFFTPIVVPVGAAFCEGCGLGTKAEGRLFFGEYGAGKIMKVRLDSTRRKVESVTSVANLTNVISIETAPDGTLYLSNNHGIYRLV